MADTGRDVTAVGLDPVRYEIFLHRLWAIGEEGRSTIQRVSASPIITQGGECMQSFYTPDGRMVLACSGHLRFAAATSDAIKKVVEWFSDDPGIFPGDQLFFNDPYVAGSHTYDQIVMQPIFVGDRLLGWTASSSHTADVGGTLRGAATEIYHEGIRILGLKVVEQGRFRRDVCKTLVEQCRDPQYVELDLRSRIAANNVATQRVLRLVEQFGEDFVRAAFEKTIVDAERMARAKLRALPDGVWRSRVWGTGLAPYQVTCTMTKAGDGVTFDFAGSSPQTPDEMNSTWPSSMAHIALALTNALFWDVPWSDGKMAPVTVRIPEGTVIHCRFPAACGSAPVVGSVLVSAVTECVAKMLFAGGRLDDVNAGWYGMWYEGGPGYFYGGHTRKGVVVPQGLYDIHGGGLGATPLRDGVDTGGHVNIPSGGISDVEVIELQYPFLYFTRNHHPNGAGYGQFRGGDGSARLFMVYGSQDLTVNSRPYGGLVFGGFGLFGGYPAGSGGLRGAFRPAPDFAARLAAGGYPTSVQQLLEEGWGELQRLPLGRVPIPEGWILSDFVQGGGGYGDPLDRDPEAVAGDVRAGIYTRWAAERFFGVVLGPAGGVDAAGTEAARRAIRQQRLQQARPVDPSWQPPPPAPARELARPHGQLAWVEADGRRWWACRRCGTVLAAADDNYKRGARLRSVPLADCAQFPLPSGQYVGVYLEYLCPGCGTLLTVEVHDPAAGPPEILWDVAPAAGRQGRG